MVVHEHAAVFWLEAVFVIPESIGADALFIDEHYAWIDLADLREPVNPDHRRDADAIRNRLPSIHRPGIPLGLKLHLWRRKRIEIRRSRKIIPHAIWIGWDELRLGERLNHNRE